MAVHEPPLGLPFVDSTFYVARPWIEWLLLAQVNFVDIEEDVSEISVDISDLTILIAANAANITILQEDVSTLQTDVLALQSTTNANEAKSYYFAMCL